MAGAVAIGHNSSVAITEILQMLPSQRALFEIPREICYLNAAGFSPLPIRKTGAYRFLRHPDAEVLICAYELPGMSRPAVWLPRTQLTLSVIW